MSEPGDPSERDDDTEDLPSSDPPSSDPPSSDGGLLDDLELDDVDVKDLLRGALAPPESNDPRITRRVQQKIREQTDGRFFADGWSTSEAPRATFLATTLLMLVVLVVLWLLLTPWGVEILGG
jgi:hypothetical protein